MVDRPPAEEWRCESCGSIILSLDNVTDALGLADSVFVEAYGRWLHEDGLRLDLDDARGHLKTEVWRAYLSWKPELSRFLPYATITLRNRLLDWMKVQRGRGERPKLHAIAESLSAPPALSGSSAGRTEDDSRDNSRVTGGASVELGSSGYPLGGAFGPGVMDREPDSLAALRREIARRRGALVEQERAMGVRTAV